MNIWFRNNITGRYLLTEAPEGHDFEYGMIGSITDEHLILPMKIFEEGKKCLAYPVSGLESLETIHGTQWLAAGEIAGFMLHLNRILEKLQNHLLTEQNLVIGRDRVFVEPCSGQLRFLVHPSADTAFTAELRELLGFFVIRADREDPAAIRLAADLLRRSEDPGFCLGELPRLLQDQIAPETTADEKQELPWEEQLPDDREDNSAGEQDPKEETAVRKETRRRGAARIESFRQPEVRNMVLRIAASQVIMFMGLLAVFLLRGLRAVRHALPVYLILCVSISLYCFIEMLSERRRIAKLRLNKKSAPG